MEKEEFIKKTDWVWKQKYLKIADATRISRCIFLYFGTQFYSYAALSMYTWFIFQNMTTFLTIDMKNFRFFLLMLIKIILFDWSTFLKCNIISHTCYSYICIKLLQFFLYLCILSFKITKIINYKYSYLFV